MSQSTFLPDVLCPSIARGRGDGDPLFAPLVQSTTYARAAIGSDPPHQYSRVSNPTVSELESALGTLEGAPAAVTFASGLAAETALFLTLLRAGDHVVCGRSVYGGTTRLLRQVLSGLGINTTFVNAVDTGAIARAVRPSTRLIFIETPANPTLELTDIASAADIARSAGALLAVDNTFLTPVLQQPLDLGADVSVYATTKSIEGHSLALGGALVSRDADLIERFRFIRKCIGAIQTPFNAWLTLNGLRTLPVRIRHQSQSAHAIAHWLVRHQAVSAVHYPTLADDAQRSLARSQHLGAHGPVVTFEVYGGIDAGRAVARNLRLITLAEHIGSVESLLTHPATMTHADVPAEQRCDVGITDGLLRLSVGLEPTQAIIDDLAQALDPLAAAAPACPAITVASNKEHLPCPA
ncbi:MAG: aminotransferase class I/II-fold pyridoxal phosphate-dependent enzyme [Phycisphaeraceae bacterium]|nr:aminotransferase class I/II-fold pyridoxal phosphate-dependent enzyme [Phycisphaeraceae bacterium]